MADFVIPNPAQGLQQRAEAKIEKTVEKVGPWVAIGSSVGRAVQHVYEAVEATRSQAASSLSSSGPLSEVASWLGMFALGGGLIANACTLKTSAEKVHRAYQAKDGESAARAVNRIFIAASGAVSGAAKLTSAAMATASVSAPAFLPVMGSAGLLAQSVFGLISGIYGEVRTHKFEKGLTERVNYLGEKPKDQIARTKQAILFDLVFGKAPDAGESVEERRERLQERKEAVVQNLGEDLYKEIVEHFKVSLDEKGLPDTSFDPATFSDLSSFENQVDELSTKVLAQYAETEKEQAASAAEWLFEQAFGTEPENDGTTSVTPEDRIRRFKIHRERFIHMTSESCYNAVAKKFGIPLDDENNIPAANLSEFTFDKDKDWTKIIEKEFVSEIYRACFQKKVFQGIKILIAALSIGAAIALLVGTGGVALFIAVAVLLAITAILMLPIGTEKTQETLGKWIWKRHRDRLMPEWWRESVEIKEKS